MTKCDVIKLAREAGFLVDGDSWIHAGAVLVDGRKSIDKQLKAFANLVAVQKAEVVTAEAYRCGYKDGMEAGAVICETVDKSTHPADLAAVIRARGNI